MRYYKIDITGDYSWTSHPYGSVPADPGAQEVLMNLEVYNPTNDTDLKVPSSGPNSTLEVKGVSWDQIKNSNSLIGLPITIRGGMMPGLPLATIQSANAGMLLSGKVLRTWGNWIGTEMSLGIGIGTNDVGQAPSSGAGSGAGTSSSSSSSTVSNSRSINTAGFPLGLITAPSNLASLALSSAVGSVSNILYGLITGQGSVDIGGGLVSSFVSGGFPGLLQPLNFIHDWQPNTPIQQAIQKTLSTVFPAAKIVMNITGQLQLPYQDAGVYQNFTQYASYIFKISKAILGANYFGIHMSAQDNTIYVSDKPATSITLTAYDFIGQPTWINPYQLECKVVMRGNVIPWVTKVSIPAGTLLNIGENATSLGATQVTHIAQEGITDCDVLKVNHIGDFRNPDGNYWCTVIVIFVKDANSSGNSSSPPDGSGGAATSGGNSSGNTPPITNNDTSQSQQIPHITIPLTPGNVSPPSSQSVLTQQRILNRPTRRVLH